MFIILCNVLPIFVLIVTVAGRTSPNAHNISKAFNVTSTPYTIIEDASLDVPDLIKKYGYPAEIHKVTTVDGHILELHRIPSGRRANGLSKDCRPVVFLMHGLLSSSADWVTQGPGKGFAYILADAGFDVWMGNARGNYYSRGHMTLNPNRHKFWHFSWHEIGHIDLAECIDYAIAKSNQPKVHYVGHSQGTTSFFVLTSTRPEYNSKFKSVHALAPVVYMKNIVSPFVRLLAPYANTLDKLTSIFGLGEFAPNSDFVARAGGMLCKESGIFLPVCKHVLFILCGYSVDQLNVTMLPVFLGHTPAGASTKQFAHYGQGVNEGLFRQYNWGALGNLKKYGSIKPPIYNLDLVTAPVALHYSDNDWMAHTHDVDRLFKALPRAIGKFRVPLASFNHLDFIWAKDADELLYKRVINLMNMFEK